MLVISCCSYSLHRTIWNLVFLLEQLPLIHINWLSLLFVGCRVGKETGTGERWAPTSLHGLPGHHAYGNHQQLWCFDSLSRCCTRQSCILNVCLIRTQGCWMPCCPTKWTTMVTLTPELTRMAGRVRLPWKQPGRFVETGGFCFVFVFLRISLNYFILI